MRIAVIGTGGIGGPLGAALLKAGIDVTLVARVQLAAMREQGLHIEGDRGETRVQPVQVRDDFDEIGAVDFVLSASSRGTSNWLASRCAQSSDRQTAVISLQNGVDAAQRLIPILGPEAVMGGVAFVTGTIRRTRRDPSDGHASADNLW